jgi:UDP-galactopyranose mutase
MLKEYDYLIVGAGLFGATFAYFANAVGKSCLVIDKRDHVAGNCYTENVEGINVHKYGPHIFHTKNHAIWEFVNKFAHFNNFRYRVKAYRSGHFFSFPINLTTMHELWGVKTPSEAHELIAKKVEHLADTRGPEADVSSIEGWCMAQIGWELYNLFIKDYTGKQWGIDPRELPCSIIKRIPIRFTFSDYYFDDCEYQGIPMGGYTPMVTTMLDGVEVRLGVDYFTDVDYWGGLAEKIVFTGPIDQFFNYKYGSLWYRSLRFEEERLDVDDYQGIVAINYTDFSVPYTRIIEHKHFESGTQPYTVITREYPESEVNGEPFYPVPTEQNVARYSNYHADSMAIKDKVLFGGRLGSYEYMNMDEVVAQALKLAKWEGLDEA